MSIQSNFPAIAPSLLLDFANTKTLDNRITFTRSTPACHYDGKTTAMAEQNLTLQSQTFDVSPWSNASLSVTANSTTAPDGTATADKLVENNVNTTHAIYQSIGTTSGLCTWSVYAKADTRNWLNLTAYVAGARNTWFDLTNGVVGTVASGCTASITAVGNGWYRCSVTTTGGSSTYFECWLANGDNVTSYAGDGTSGLFVWGAQLEQRSTATAYTVTTTQPITNYIPVLLSAGGNQARFDCNPTTGESLGLLIEEQRTNIFSDSSAFQNWTILGGTVTQNAIVAPDGTLSGEKYSPSASTQFQLVYKLASVSGVHTFSTYAKAGEYNQLMLWTDNPVAFGITAFNLTNGTVFQSGASHTNITITPVGNGWYRCSITVTTTTASTPTFYIGIAPSGNTGGQFVGNGFSGGYIWGAQLEAGSFATSYIATTSASATRTADIAVMTGTNFSSWYNQAQGTIYAEGQINYNPIGGGSNAFYSIDDTSASTNVIQPYFSSSSGILFSFVSVNGLEQANTGATPISASTFFKHAQIYQTNNFASVVNNLTVATDSTGVTPVVTQLQFANGKSKYFRKFAYYPLVVTSSQLQALTS
jgi:hypothetical protein